VRTLRGRTTLVATALTALVLIVASSALLAVLSAQLTKSGDQTSRSRARALLELAADGDLPRTVQGLDDESVAQVLAADGTVLAASANVAGGPPIIEPTSGSQTLRVMTVDAPDDKETERYRLWVVSGPSPDGAVTVAVGRSLESVHEATRRLRNALLVGVPLVLVLLAAAIWGVVGRALRRIDHITTAVSEIGDRDLDRRVPEPGVDDEVGRLATTMNRMLERLEDSSTRQRAFVADASHDLQSPLTAQRTKLEVAVAHPDRVDLEELGRELLADGAQMEALVQDLLQVAAGDQGTPPSDDLLDFDTLVLEEVARVRAGTTVRIDTAGVSAAPVRGEATQLRRLVRNLLDNATRHAREQVDVALAVGSDGVVLDVADDGPGVPPADRARVFDRFFRGDSARGPSEGGHRGSGLGLAIARDIAERHRGTLELVDESHSTAHGEGTTGAQFRLRLPPVR
jgi:signal transduction histidine kinase